MAIHQSGGWVRQGIAVMRSQRPVPPSSLACLMGLLCCSCDCSDGGSSSVPDSSLPDAASADSGLDAGADAGPGPDGGADAGLERLPECEPQWWEWIPGRVAVDATTDGHLDHEEFEMFVAEATDAHYWLQADPENHWEQYVVIYWPEVDPVLPSTLPPPGERVVVLGGICGEGGYLRLRDLEGNLLFEGGDPACTELRRASGSIEWDLPALLSLEPAESEGWCRDRFGDFEEYPEGECCCMTRKNMEVILTLPGEAPEIVLRGEERTLTLEGRSYRLLSQGAFSMFDSRCTRDFRTPFGFGSAYLFLLPE